MDDLSVHKTVLGQLVAISLLMVSKFFPSDSFVCRGTLKKKVLAQMRITNAKLYFKYKGASLEKTKYMPDNSSVNINGITIRLIR